MEISPVGKLPNSNGYSYVITSCDVFSQNLFAESVQKPDTTFVVRALMHILTQHAYVPKHINTDRRTAFTSQLMIKIIQASRIKTDQATPKHRQNIGMFERTHQKLIFSRSSSELTHRYGTNTSWHTILDITNPSNALRPKISTDEFHTTY